MKSILPLCLVLLCSACVAASPGLPGRAFPDAARDVLAGAATDVYAPVTARPWAGASSEDLRAVVQGALPAEARATLRHDLALDCLAAASLEVYAEAFTSPVQSLMEWLAWRCGVVSALLNVRFYAAQGRLKRERLDEELGKVTREVIGSAANRAYGVVRREQGQWIIQALVVDESEVLLGPVPKVFPPGATLSLDVRPRAALEEPAFFMDLDGGKVRRHRARIQRDGRILLRHVLPKTPGRYFIELAALDPASKGQQTTDRWNQVFLRFPVYVGIAEFTEPDAFMTAPTPNPQSADGWRRTIVAAYNAQRARLGRTALVLEPQLTTYAQERSVEAARTTTHLPLDRGLKARIEATGFVPRWIWQFRHRSVHHLSDHVGQRMLSPSARRRILAVDATKIGVGITLAPGPNANDAEPASMHWIVEYLVGEKP